MEIEEINEGDNLTKRFIKGLENFNLTAEEIKRWIRCGGSDDIDKFREIFPDRNLPPHQEYCICGHDIIHNKYITNLEKTEILVLGSCCVQRFCPKKCDTCYQIFKSTSKTCKECRDKKHKKDKLEKQKLCDVCKEPHKNRKYNLCNVHKEYYSSCVKCEKYYAFNSYDNNHINKMCKKCYNQTRKDDIEENYKKSMKAKKGLINANQTATKIKQIKICSECNNNYETYNTIEEECLCNGCKNNKQMQIEEENRKMEEENIKKMQRYGLMCDCELRTVLREVKKDGKNKGRLFYCCSQHYEDKCDYFMWKDESDRRRNKNIEHKNKTEEEHQDEQSEEKMPDENVQMCFCNLPVVLREVKKDGQNKGKMFYTCSKYYDDKCKYFVWKD